MLLKSTDNKNSIYVAQPIKVVRTPNLHELVVVVHFLYSIICNPVQNHWQGFPPYNPKITCC